MITLTQIPSLIQSCQDNLDTLLQSMPLDRSYNRLDEIDNALAKNNAWSDQKLAANLMKERTQLASYLELTKQSQDTIEFVQALLDSNEESQEEFSKLNALNTQLNDLLFKQMMCEPTDNMPAILTIGSGAGGAEACNWVSMLLRMYLRYATSQGFKTEILDESPSKENSTICLDAVSIRVEGPYAFGYLKNEAGVHRLIRNSPFSSTNARHTSFAAVQVSPDIEDEIEIKIADKDLEITAQRSSGAGGQNTNKVSSACRIKHLPTGINILSRSSRDYPKNKASALKMLKSRLYDIELQKKQTEKDKQLDAQSSASFGHQVRSYILSPQKLVKDHRSDFQTNDADGMLDGNSIVHDFMTSVLRAK